MEGQGARPLEVPKNLHLTVPKSGSNIAQQYVDGYAFFHVHCSTKSQENLKGKEFNQLPAVRGGGGIFIPHHQTISCHSETPSAMAPKLCDFLFLPFGHIMTKF